MNWEHTKKQLKKIWHFLWKEDSIYSWVVNIILAFILIKFIIYPGIGFILGTQLPVVAVISESMEHRGDFETWWKNPALCGDANILYNNYTECTQADWYEGHRITKEQFQNFPMHNGFNKGDIIILKGATYDSINVGDIIVFQSKLAYPIIHRVIEKNDFIQTKGDHNPRQIQDPKLNEKYVTKDLLLGKAWIKIPLLGYIKIWFSGLINCLATGFNQCTF